MHRSVERKRYTNILSYILAIRVLVDVIYLQLHIPTFFLVEYTYLLDFRKKQTYLLDFSRHKYKYR